MRYMKAKELAKDALQEALVHTISNLHKYEDQGKFKAWLGTVTTKKCLDQLRKQKRHKYSDIDDYIEPGRDEDITVKMEKDSVIDFMNKLPDNYRISLNMFLVEGYSHKEIGEHLDISESSSRSLVSRGRKLIKDAFQQERLRAESRMQPHIIPRNQLRIIRS